MKTKTYRFADGGLSISSLAKRNLFTRSSFLISLLLILVFQHNLYGQKSYLEIIEQSETKDFKEICERIDKFFEEKGKERGSGWNHYQRWKEFTRTRLSADGKIVNTESVIRGEANKYRTELKKRINARTAATAAFTGNWVSLGPLTHQLLGGGYNGGVGRVNFVYVDPADASIVYACTPSGGLWRRNAAGNTWIPLTDNFSATLGVSGIAIDPNSPVNNRTIYILTGDGDGGTTNSIGVLKSTNGGASWNTTGLSWSKDSYNRGYKLLIHPNNSNILFAITNSGIYKTSDAGASWSLKVSGSFKDAEFKPNSPSTIYAASDGSIWKTDNTGEDWSPLPNNNGLPTNNFDRIALAVTPANPEYVYALYGGVPASGEFTGVFRSENSGSTFSRRSNTPNILGYDNWGFDQSSQAWYDLAIAASPVNANEIITGGINTWKSNDGGQTWAITSHWIESSAGQGNYTHADVHNLEYYGNTLYCGSDGGVFNSTNHAEDWTNISNGLSITQIYRMGLDVNNAGRIVCGAQDNGMNILENKILHHWFGADGFEGIIDPTNSNVIYGCYQNGGLLKSTDGGLSNFSIMPSNSGGGNWLTPYVIDKNNTQKLFALYYNGIFRTTDGGFNWTNVYPYSGEEIMIAPSNSNIVYVLNYNNLYKSVDGGSTWSVVNSNLPYGLMHFTISNEDPNVLWLGGLSQGTRVYKSTDGGLTITDVSGTLPNLTINCLIHQKGSKNGVYVGNDMGVFYKDDNLSDWILFSTGMPNVIVNELEIHYSAKKLRAATYGRGIWESDLYESSSPVSNIALNKPTFASSIEATGYEANKATDGNPTTRWSSLRTDPQWIYVDLQGTYDINRVRIAWEVASAKDFIIQTSDDAQNWINRKEIFGNTSGATNDITDISGSGRYVRVYGINRTTVYGNSIFELEVYGTPKTQNQLPIVALTAPSNNQEFTLPASVTVSANASDADGSISKVDFYAGSQHIGTATNHPYSIIWSGMTAGSYSLTAVATDNANAQTTSQPINVIIKEGQTNENLALNKTAFASTTENSNFPASYAVDGFMSTRWSSVFSDPQWLYVDLASTYTINRVKVSWEYASSRVFTIQVSNDASNWQTINTVTNNAPGAINDITGLNGSGRYVRIYSTARATEWGNSIYELEVYGTGSIANQSPTVSITSPANNSRFDAPASINITTQAADPDGSISRIELYNNGELLGMSYDLSTWTMGWSGIPAGTYSLTAIAYDNTGASSTSSIVTIYVGNINIALNKPAFASSIENGDFPASYANDGQSATRWSSAFADPQWWYVDLQGIYNINRAVIKWETASSKDFNLQVSNDAVTWQNVSSTVGNTQGATNEFNLSASGRYVRIYSTSRATEWGNSIIEFELYGSAAAIIAAEVTADEDKAVLTANDVKVFPNPTSSDLHLAFNTTETETNIVITSLNGHESIRKTVETSPGANLVEISVNALPVGLYVVTIVNDSTYITRTIEIKR